MTHFVGSTDPLEHSEIECETDPVQWIHVLGEADPIQSASREAQRPHRGHGRSCGWVAVEEDATMSCSFAVHVG